LSHQELTDLGVGTATTLHPFHVTRVGRPVSNSYESILHLTRAEALHALGRTEEARVAIVEARARILRLASTFEPDADTRSAYLTNIEANARTLKLASEWLEGAAAG
jgi:hypothetical protein